MPFNAQYLTKAAIFLLGMLMLVQWATGPLAKAAESTASEGIPLHLLQGEMRALKLTEPPRLAPKQTPFKTADGRELTLESLDGHWRLVNLWATWCAPCREEMPALDRLANAYAGRAFEVITIASGQHSVREIERFMDETDIRRLPAYQSPDSAIARGFGVLGLPTSVLIDPAGREIARLTGSADWFSEEARALIDYLLTPHHCVSDS
jgi:thiol-disulfide isomerase/thioredoxin